MRRRLDGALMIARRAPVLGLMIFDALHSAWAFHAHPETFASGAYAYALGWVPASTWRFVWLGCAVGIIAGVVFGHRLIRAVSLLAYAVACAVFAVSIAELIFEGFPGALVGASKWGLVSVMAFRLATAPTVLGVIDGSDGRRGADDHRRGDGVGGRLAHLPEPQAGTPAGPNLIGS